MTLFRKQPDPFAIISEHISFFAEGPLLETWEFFEISHGGFQLMDFLPYLTLSTQDLIFKLF